MSYFPKTSVLFEPSNQSAFGTLETGELTPVFQTDFIHGINSQTGVAVASGVAATATTNAGRLALTSGTGVAGSATYRSRRPCKYRAGQGMMARFTPVYAAPIASHRQLFGAGNEDDGYLIGYEGLAFGIRHRNNAGSDAWIAQADWNGDKCDGTGASGFNWQPQNGYGVPVMIKYPFLGYGNIMFFVQSPVTGEWILAHMIRYANTLAMVQISNPNLFFWAENINDGNTTTKTTYCGSVGMFLSGVRSFVSCPKRGTDQTVTTIDATERAILHIKNATTYNGVTNRSLIRLQGVSVAARNASAQIITLRFRIGATWGGTPPATFAVIDADGSSVDQGNTITTGNTISSRSIDASITPTGGHMPYNLVIATEGGGAFDLTPLDLFISPGEILSISAVASSSVGFVGVGLNWVEDI